MFRPHAYQLALRSAIAGAVLVSACANLPAIATEIRVAAQDASSPKFVMLHQDGKTAVGGLCVDIMRAIERIEPDITFVGEQTWEPLTRIEADLEAGQLDAACGLIRNAERESRFNYIDTPLFTSRYFLAVRADDDVQVKNWDDIKKLGDQGIILAIHGFGIIAKMEKIGGLKIDSGGLDAKTNLDKLLAGRGRFYIHRSPGIRQEIKQAGVQDKVKLLPVVMYREDVYMVMSKKLAPDVREKIRKGIIQLNASGEIARLLRKWDSGEE